MLSKIKKIAIIVGLVIVSIGIIVLLIVTAGKNKKIKELLGVITNAWQKNVLVKTEENTKLDTAYDALTAQEKAIIETIKNEPSLVLPPNIDPKDYKAVLKWFRELEKYYD